MDNTLCATAESMLLEKLTKWMNKSDKFVYEVINETSFKVSFFPVICDCKDDPNNSNTIVEPVSFVVTINKVPYA